MKTAKKKKKKVTLPFPQAVLMKGRQEDTWIEGKPNIFLTYNNCDVGRIIAHLSYGERGPGI